MCFVCFGVLFGSFVGVRGVVGKGVADADALALIFVPCTPQPWRARRKQTCWNAVKHASYPRIHTFIATSDIHMQHKLKKSRQEVLDITR